VRRIILASHGEFANGALNTLQMIIGNVQNVYAFALERDDKMPLSNKVIRFIKNFDNSDEIFILTDMVGSSVNNDMVSMLRNYPNLTLISGMNMPLILTLASEEGPIDEDELEHELQMSRDGLVNCNRVLKKQQDEEDDEL
jgi:mannose/fructose-specific phosphotransferase system component IIA